MDMQKQTGMTGSPIASASALFWDACWADGMRDLAVRHAACMFRQIKSRMCLDMVFDCLLIAAAARLPRCRAKCHMAELAKQMNEVAARHLSRTSGKPINPPSS